MEIEGRIIAVCPEQGGVSARTGNAWKSQEYVIETHDTYPRKCCFRVFGADRITSMNIQLGEELRVSFDIDARQYQDRSYNTLSAWKVDRIDPTVPQASAGGAQQPVAAPFPPQQGYTPESRPEQQQAQSFPPAQPANDTADDLPF